MRLMGLKSLNSVAPTFRGQCHKGCIKTLLEKERYSEVDESKDDKRKLKRKKSTGEGGTDAQKEPQLDILGNVSESICQTYLHATSKRG